MSLRRAFIALLFAVTWFSAVLHGDLEAIDWMLEHDHGHVHTHDGGSLPLPSADGEHEPVFARPLSSGADAPLAPALKVFGPIGLLGLLACLALAVRPPPVAQRVVRRWRDFSFPTSWQFAWRCAPDSAAPPALSC